MYDRCITGVLQWPDRNNLAIWGKEKGKKASQQNLCVFVANICCKFYMRLYLPPSLEDVYLSVHSVAHRVMATDREKKKKIVTRNTFCAFRGGKLKANLFSVRIYIHRCTIVCEISKELQL